MNEQYNGEWKNWDTESAATVLQNEVAEYHFSQRLRSQLRTAPNKDYITVLAVFLKLHSKKYDLGEVNRSRISWKEIAEDFLARLIEEEKIKREC